MLKKQNRIALLLIVTVVSGILSACAKPGESSSEVKISAQEEERYSSADANLQADFEDESNITTVLGPDDSDEELTDDDVYVPMVSAEECMKEYQRFLNNEALLCTDKYANDIDSQNSEFEYSCLKDILVTSGKYNFSQFIEAFSKAYSNDVGSTVIPESISYAYIDCGNDRIPELLVTIGDLDYMTMDYHYIFVIKLMNDKQLQMVFYDDFGYRGYGELNEYGYYAEGGSGGAASWADNYHYINAAGDVKFVYGQDVETSVWSLYVPDNDEYNNVAQEYGIDENIEVVQTYLDEYKPDDDYTDFLKNSMWIYYALDDSGRVIEDENGSIYAENHPYKKFWDSIRIYKLYSEDEVSEAIRDKRDELHIDEVILNGATVVPEALAADQHDRLFEWVSFENAE